MFGSFGSSLVFGSSMQYSIIIKVHRLEERGGGGGLPLHASPSLVDSTNLIIIDQIFQVAVRYECTCTCAVIASVCLVISHCEETHAVPREGTSCCDP